MSDTDKMDSNKATEQKELENISNSKPTTNKPKKKSRKRKINSINDDDNYSIKDDQPKKKKRKKKRGWSEQEETLFREGLELYGRDWNKVSKHVGHNRNTAAIRSHAQIYLLRLLQNGKKMSNKLLETGNGYTLSGKPLNKYSVVAARHFNGAQNVPMVDGVISDEENVPTRKTKLKNGKNGKISKKKGRKKKLKYYDSSDSDSDAFEDYSTNTNINKPVEVRRSGRNRKQILVNDPPHISNPFGLRTDIEMYDHMILDENKNKSKHKHQIYEPFRIFYCPNALLIADIHAHLLRKVEIMGLLGGTYDINTRCLYIKKCYPLNEEQQNETTVSPHSTEILNVSERIKNEDGLEFVGWYHSHPCFDNVPSNLDCHQHSINKYENEKKQPYVGLIVQSLWNRDETYTSHWRWFNTKLLNKDNRNDYQYIALEFNANKKIYNGIDDGKLYEQIVGLVERYNGNKYDIYRTDFGENEIGEKILDNIKYHLEIHHGNSSGDEEEDGNDEIDNKIDELIKKIKELFLKQRKVWWVTNTPKIEENKDVNKENEDINNDNKQT